MALFEKIINYLFEHPPKHRPAPMLQLVYEKKLSIQAYAFAHYAAADLEGKS